MAGNLQSPTTSATVEDVILQLRSEIAALQEEIETKKNTLKNTTNHPCVFNLTRGQESWAIESLKLRKWKAEIAATEQAVPQVLPQQPEILFECLREELENSFIESKEVLVMMEEEKARIKTSIGRLKETENVEKEFIDEARAKLSRMEKGKQESKTEKMETELKKRCKKAKKYLNKLMTDFAEFLDEKFPAPTKEDLMEFGTNEETDLLTMADLLEVIMNQWSECPEDPYVKITAAMWPPYLELLFRFHIIVRHPEDHNKIKLENFDQ